MTLLDICLLDTGHVMDIDGSLLSTANLEYSVDKMAGLGCQIRYLEQNCFLRYAFYNQICPWLTVHISDFTGIWREVVKYPMLAVCFCVIVIGLLMCFSFWYHIYDDKPLSSLDLKLKIVRGTAAKDLLKISECNTDGWENAKVPIGNQPGGYKVSIRSCVVYAVHKHAVRYISI